LAAAPSVIGCGPARTGRPRWHRTSRSPRRPRCSLQVGPVVDRGPALGRVEMLEPVAPVRQRHVVVDPDEIDLRIGPERIEVEEHVARTVARLVPEILRPVGRIADLRPGPEDRAHIREQIPIGLHRRIGAGARADGGQPRHLGADQEGIDPARRRAEMGVVQHHAAQAPVAGRAGPRDRLTRDAEARGRGRAEQRRDLACRSGGLVHGPGEACGGRTGDPPPPGEGGLARLGGVVGIRVRQRVAGRHVHQDEGIEGDAQPARLHLLDRLHHGEVGGRAAIDRAILIVAADEEGIGAADAVHGPAVDGVVDLAVTSTPGRTLQLPARRSSPNQATTSDTLSTFRGHGLQPVQRHHHVGGVGQRVEVLGLGRRRHRPSGCPAWHRRTRPTPGSW
jgi:hypothetical protein